MKIAERIKTLKDLLPLYATAYQRNILLAAFIAIVSILCIVSMGMVRVKRENARREHFYSLLRQYEESPSLETLSQLISKAQASTFLQKQYASALLQEDIYSGNEKLAKKLIANLFSEKGTKNFELYEKFTKTTFDISKKNYAVALDDAIKLGSEIASSVNPSSYFVLSTINDLRIALLYQKLGNFELEIKEYQKLMADKNKTSFLEAALQEGKLNIMDYMKYRMSQVQSS